MYITNRILKFGKRYHPQIFQTVILCFIMSVLSMTWMALLGATLAEIIQQRHAQILMFFIILLSLCRFFMKQIELKIVHKNSVGFKKRVRTELMEKLFSMGPMVYDEERTGKLANMIWMKVDWLEYYYDEYLPRSISMIFFHFLMSIIYISILGMKGMIYPIAIMLVLLTPNFFHKEAMKRGKEEWEAESSYSSDSLDGIQGMVTLKSLNYVGKHQEIMQNSTEKWYQATMRNLKLTTFENNFMSLFIQVSRIFVIILMGNILMRGQITQSEFMILFFATIGATDDAYNILGAWIKGAKGISGVDEIIDFVLNAESRENHVIRENVEEQHEFTCVEYDKVDFAYEEENILQNISFSLPIGKKLTIVGASGGGKSTIAYLLSGFYQPQSGRIVCMDTEGKKSDFQNRSQFVTAVWQDSRVFHTTVFQNILMGNKEKTLTDVIEAAKRANIHQKIMSLPKGYQTVIGDGGENLSGGEKQRIIIARAFLKDTPILILDEATAYLDGGNEMQIQESVQSLCQGRAVLAIAHRIETVKNSDFVILLKNGKVKEKGTHLQLAQKSEEYRKLFGINSQK
ncbi:MAG: ABC transporter ATP-binding protein [Roseburia sp.]